jgi:hypothetical protein
VDDIIEHTLAISTTHTVDDSDTDAEAVLLPAIESKRVIRREGPLFVGMCLAEIPGG